jgi:hypothetical protein
MDSELGPFEIIEKHGRTILRLHGTSQQPARVEASETRTILTAFVEGLDVDIRYATILGPFELTPISGEFERTENGRLRVAGTVDFWNSTFLGPVSLRGASFGGNVHLFSCTFTRNTSFSGASFRRDADFRSTVFNGDVAFMDVLFCGDAHFGETEFYGEVRFGGAFAERPASFSDIKFRENTVLAGLWNHILRPFLNLPAHLFSRELPERKVTTFLGLNTTIIDGASNAYLKRYIGDEQWIRSWRLRGKIRQSLFLFWELTSHCGRSFGLWMFWVLAAATVFGAVFADYSAPAWLPEPIEALLIRMDPDVAVSSSTRIPTPFTPYYFSIVTFTTLGFGDIHPLNFAGEVWLVVEVLLGYVMLGGLIGIFANKLARRS